MNICFFVSILIGLDFMDNSGVQVDYENALINAGFGKFHIYLLIVCGMIYMNTAIGITIISFVLPSATCDFRMSSSDKGLLTAAPMLGRFIISDPVSIHYLLCIWPDRFLKLWHYVSKWKWKWGFFNHFTLRKFSLFSSLFLDIFFLFLEKILMKR